MNKLIKYLLVILVFQTNMVIAETNSDSPQNKEDWRGLLNLARKAYHDKEYQKAILFYETALPVLPKGIDLTEEIAQTMYRMKQLDNAATLYKNQKNQDKLSIARKFHNLGNIAMEKKEYKKAIEEYKKSLRQNPSNEKTRYNLSEAIRKLKEDKQNNPPPKEEENKKNEPKENPDDKDSKNPADLNNQTVQRELDKLMKKEIETKRKLANNKEGKGGLKSQKDW